MKSQSQIYSRYFTYIRPVTKILIIRTYGSTIFTLLITAIFIIFAIRPTIETILVLQKKLEDSNQVLQKVNLKANNLTVGKQNYENLDPAFKSKLSSAIPDSVQLRTVIETLEQSASNNEASVSALQFQPLDIAARVKDTIGALSEIEFIFNAEGKYENLISLLQELRSSARLISIDSLSLSKITEGEGLVMSITGKAYFLK